MVASEALRRNFSVQEAELLPQGVLMDEGNQLLKVAYRPSLGGEEEACC